MSSSPHWSTKSFEPRSVTRLVHRHHGIVSVSQIMDVSRVWQCENVVVFLLFLPAELRKCCFVAG